MSPQYTKNMNENKLLVFEKKEIILIFLFVLVMVVTSFTLGIRMGKRLAFEKQGIYPQETEISGMKSPDEELADKILEGRKSAPPEDDAVEDETFKRLQQEFETLSNGPKASQGQDEATRRQTGAPSTTEERPSDPDSQIRREDISEYKGKLTVQLGAYRDLEQAREFAAGFKVRGYDPIINEVEIEGRGVWYRVSLGLFNSEEEAQRYIQSEQSLFEGQSYLIKKIQ